MTSSDQQAVLAFLDAYPQMDTFEALLPDLNGRLRGKWLSREHLDKAFNSGLKLPLTTLGFDIWGRDPESWVFESGDADGICVAEAATLAPVPWLSESTGQLLMSLRRADGIPCGSDPRDLLRNIQQRLKQLGYTPVVALEMEFYLFDTERDTFGRPTHSQRAIDGGPAVGGQTYSMDQLEDEAPLMRAIRDACIAQQLPVDTLIAEAAPSQYEVNLYHGNDALLAADHGLMLQRLIKAWPANTASWRRLWPSHLANWRVAVCMCIAVCSMNRAEMSLTMAQNRAVNCWPKPRRAVWSPWRMPWLFLRLISMRVDGFNPAATRP